MLNLVKCLALIGFAFVLTSCDEWVTQNWKIENQTSENIQIRAINVGDGTEFFNSISPGSVLTIQDDFQSGDAIGSLRFVDEVQLFFVEDIVISNSAQQVYLRDIDNFENWQPKVIDSHVIDFILTVTEEDF